MCARGHNEIKHNQPKTIIRLQILPNGGKAYIGEKQTATTDS